MDQRTKSIIFGAIGLLVLASVLGTTVYLGRLTKNTAQVESDVTDNPLSELPVSAASPAVSQGTDNQPASTLKAYIGQGFSVLYPANWGLLTCSNSNNFELDPQNLADTKNFTCDRAVKPVTVLVGGQLNCEGETVKIGSYQVVKSKVAQEGSVNYRWCLTAAGKNFDITHRVSRISSPAVSKDDLSAQVEQAIGNIASTPAGS